MLPLPKIQKKRGVSIMVGYVLLIVGAIALSAVVYYWMKSYVPVDTPECTEGVSMFITEQNCEIISGKANLNITVKNNGRFGIMGMLIRASETEDQEIPNRDLSKFVNYSGTNSQEGGPGGEILFLGGDNNLMPEETKFFRINSSLSNIYLIEIVPTRIEIQGKKKILTACSDQSVKEVVTCI